MPTMVTFTAGTPILSADVNANFAAVNTEVEAAIIMGYSSVTSIANALTGEDTLHAWTMPAGTLAGAADGYEIYAWGDTASNANAKTFKFYPGGAVGGGTAITLNPTTTAPLGQGFLIHVLGVYVGALSWNMCTTIAFNNGNRDGIYGNSIVSADPSGAITLTFTGTATSTNDIVMRIATIRTFRAP